MYSFPRQKRLTNKADYDHVFNHAKKVVTPNFIFFYCKNTLPQARLGLALSKKKIPKAHDRNRAKRLLRDSFRCYTLPSVDLVVLAKQGVAKSTNAALLNQIGLAWDKITQSVDA